MTPCICHVSKKIKYQISLNPNKQAVEVNRNYAAFVESSTKKCRSWKIANSPTPSNRKLSSFCCSGRHSLVVFVEPFVEKTEAYFEFPLPISKFAHPEEIQDERVETPEAGPEDRS